MSLDALTAALEALTVRLDESRRDTVDAGDFRDLVRIVLKQQHLVAEADHRANNTFRWGTVKEVDAEKGYEVAFGDDADGKPLPSAWIPHPEQGGAYKTWRPSTKGQIVGVLCPNGDQRQAILFPKGGFSDDNPAPSDKLDENVETYGKVKTTWKAESTKKEIGDKVSVTTTDKDRTTKTEKVTVTAGADTHQIKTERASTTQTADKHTIVASGSKLETSSGKVLADASLFRATKKVILASG